jgi:hypothetical protein
MDAPPQFDPAMMRAPAPATGVMFVPWHIVLLKHPGVVPAGAGLAGFRSEFAPFAWHLKHSGAFPWSVCTCVGSDRLVLTHGLSGCGAFVWHDLHDGVIPTGLS